jgi:hypothetical protein
VSERAPRRLGTRLRWVSIALRSLHVVGAVMIGVAIFAGQSPVSGASLAFATGIALGAIEWWRQPGYWREVAGLAVAAKIGLLAAIVHAPALAAALFWGILVASSVIAHAPRAFRHRRLLG